MTSSLKSKSLSPKRLRWLAMAAPFVIVGVVEYARYAADPVLTTWPGHLLLDAAILMGALFFYGALFTVYGQMQADLERKNRELSALRIAGLDVVSDLSLDTVLDKVVDQARQLIGARYGALAVVDRDDTIRSFLTSGVDPERRRRIGDPPRGRGLLGVVLRGGERLRVADIGRDRRSCGFPTHHPEMRSLLAVPIVCRGPFRGNLYLSEKLDGSAFSAEEEEILERFAAQAAVAIDNAHLHRQVRELAAAEERLHLAHEMHDGQAQVLAYVNTKAQAVKELLKAGRHEEAGEHLEQLAKAAREVYADVREGILGLRTAITGEHGLKEALRHHVEQWQDRYGIATELRLDGEPRLSSDVELQLIRIVQEALANVRKHSGARSVRVEVAGHDGRVRIAVEDDGVGFDPEDLGRSGMPRFGLATMRERSEAIGARLSLESRPDAGTRVEVRYPA